MKKRITATIALIVLMMMFLPTTTVLAFQIQTMPGAMDLTELQQNLSKNGYSAYSRQLSGENRLWQDLDPDQYTLLDQVIFGAPTPGAEATEIERWSIAYPKGVKEIRVPEKEYSAFQTPMPHAKDDKDFIEQAAWIKAEFGRKSTVRKYADKPTDWESQRDYFLENGYSWQEFHGYQTLFKEDFHPEDSDPDKENAYSNRGYSEWNYVVVLVPEGQADYVAYVTIDVKSFVGAPTGFTLNYDGTEEHYGVVDAEWVAASKSLWDSQTSPAIEEAINQVFAMDFRFARQRVYTGELVFGGAAPKNDTKTDAGVTKQASDTSGEDGGVSVPGAIAVGVLAGGAAILAGAGSSGDDEKKKKSYKMYVQKDFGGAIRKGANPVKIRARMAEVDEFGKEHDRDDLTAKIGVSGDGITVHSVILSGRYCEATVSVPEDSEDEKAGILFVFEGEGGTFTNKVIFRLIDEAYIHFVEENEDGSLKPLGNRTSFDAILGDKRDYSALFLLRDATEEPVRFNTESEGGNFRIRVEPTDRQYLYRAVFDNRSAAPEENEIFSKIIKQVQYITAVFSDGTEAGCYATASLFPEGLSVRAEKVENERIPIRCYGMEEYENVSDRFTGEKFYLTLAVKTEQGAAVFHLLDKKVNTVFGKKMEGDTRLNSPEADKVAEKFTFKIDPAGGGEFFFIPKDWLFQPEAETIYGAVLSVACTYDGVRYERYIPFRLIGQLPDPMGDWNKEYNDLRRRVEKFSLPGQKDTWVKRFEECSTKPPCSVEELRLVSKEILHRYMEYWEKHNEEDKAECLKYDNLLTIAEWTKFIGDCAFSTLMRIYAGPLADCIITPCKDIFLYSLGEWLASYSRGESFDVKNLEIYKSLNTAGDLVSYMYVSKGIKANPKKMFYYIAGYFVIAIFRNYLKKLGEKGESDWWGAITAAFKDLTISSLRFAAGELFQKWLNSKSFQKLFGEQLQKQIIGEIKLTNDVNISGKGITITENVAVVTQMTKAAERFLVKFAGKGAGIVYDTLPARFAASQFGRNEQGHPVYCFPLNDPNSDATIYIEINLVQMITCASTGFLAPLTYLFQVFFNGLIGANAPISIERDPPAERQRSRELKSEAELKAGYQAMFSDAGDHP